ncbi:hypothetical protein CERSUDRAFT_87546 [Gelatoporia subvermispora B]|uniref:Wax synthase domain-containing protein n=1 Tax=Ceriporiopsis subvermispora (strain B) TaxID=914234 RepID=M2R2W2_CERS8|nr:hypothetical protein CERSUDRAFT_87546 [Gelatoporia subvermispora B]
MPFHRRVYWVLCIGHCPRGVGWNWQVANVPSPPQDTHRVFVRKQLLRLMRCFLLLDIAQSYIHLNPLFARSGIEARSIASQGYGMRCLSIVAWGYTPYGMITMQYSLLAAVHVGLGYSDPESWPDLFGVWRDAYTVRRFWGRTWHQLIRRFVSAYGKLACHSLGFEQGTTASSYTQLYVAFLVSGIMHSGGDLMLGPAYLGASLPFFMLQSVAISIEDGVFALANRWRAESALREVGRVVGYVWVLVWFSVSMPCYVDWAVRAGLGRSEVLPVSPIRYLYGMILRWTI